MIVDSSSLPGYPLVEIARALVMPDDSLSEDDLSDDAVADPHAARLRARACVCRLMANGRPGTGFLVAPDLVLTCHHVLAGVAPLEAVEVLFDYQLDPTGRWIARRACHLAADQSNLPSAPADPMDQVLREDAATGEATLDYRLVRLREKPGFDMVAGDVNAPVFRGWIDPPRGAVIRRGEPLGILHHPDGNPLAETNRQQSVRLIVPHRIRHTTPTRPGSSGAPCFDVTWRWVAVHQRGVDKLKGYTWNSAIPADRIRDHIHATSKVRLGPYTPPAFRIDFAKPQFIDFRPTSFPMEKPAPDPAWMDNDLLITVPVNLNLTQGVQPVQLTGIAANLLAFPSAPTYRWKWKAKVAKYGKGTTGQYASARPQNLRPGKPLVFGAQFGSSLGTHRPTWRQFHDFILATEVGKIVLTLTFLIEGCRYDMPIELSTLHLRELFAEGDKNGYGMTRYMQPRTL